MRAFTVARNGVYQQLNEDYVTKGHTVVFKRPPALNDVIELTATTNNSHNRNSYVGNGGQTTFHLPAFPASKFEVIRDSKESIPTGYSVVDVNYEIEMWIRDNCAIHEWKWADQLEGTSLTGNFGMVRLILKDSVVTYIATRWA